MENQKFDSKAKGGVLRYVNSCQSPFFLEVLISQAEARLKQLKPEHRSGNGEQMAEAQAVHVRRLV